MCSGCRLVMKEMLSQERLLVELGQEVPREAGVASLVKYLEEKQQENVRFIRAEGS